MDFPWRPSVEGPPATTATQQPIAPPPQLPVLPQQEARRAQAARRGLFGAFLRYFVGFDEELPREKKQRSTKLASKYEISGESEHQWKPLEDNSIVRGVVLSLWDNISGPRVEQAWHTAGVPPTLLLQSAPFTLNGEMITNNDTDAKENNRVEQKFLVLSNFFSPSLIFCAKCAGEISKYALSFIFPKEIMDKYLRVHHVVKDRMMQLVEAYKSISESGATELSQKFDQFLTKLLKDLKGLFEVIPTGRLTLPSGAPAPPYSFSQTIFVEENLDATTRNFLVQVITSQLQTGCTLVVGSNEATVKKWLFTLWLFLLPHQRHVARISAIPNQKEAYVPDLSLQGLVLPPGVFVSDEQIIGCLVPSTLVDVDSLTVKQTHPYHEYLVIHRDYQEEQRRRIASMASRADNLWEAKEDLFRTVEAAPMVAESIDRVFNLPAAHPYLREGFICQTMVLFVRKTLTLIKYAEALRQDKKLTNGSNNNEHGNELSSSTSSLATSQATSTPSSSVPPTPITSPAAQRQTPLKATARKTISNSSQPGTSSLNASANALPGKTNDPENQLDPRAQVTADSVEPHETKKRIKGDLQLEEACYFVLLGIAEKLQPGTYVQVAGNPAWIEEKLIELFERF